MSPSEEGFDFSASAEKVDVDQRISLRSYCRIANNLLWQADIFRHENNIIDLYVILLRFSSLVMETIPHHRDYKAFPEGSKVDLKKKLLLSLTELEQLKSVVQAKSQELQTKKMYQLTGQQNSLQIRNTNSLFELPANGNYYITDKRLVESSGNHGYPWQNSSSFSKPTNEQFYSVSQSVLRPKEETLSKHSILGPAGLSGQWQAPAVHKIQYPSNIQFTPCVIPRDCATQQTTKQEVASRKDEKSVQLEVSDLKSLVNTNSDKRLTSEPDSLISFDVDESFQKTDVIGQPVEHIIRQPSPPPVLAEVQELMSVSTLDTQTKPTNDVIAGSEGPLELHISTNLMDTFMKLAKPNTKRNLETCGILAGSLKNRKFYITTLIIPKQESTENSCQAINEEEIFEVQDHRRLFPLGWIHTHPTQSCFMSSIDVHTHYSYQIMLPESVAIVMAPKDSSRTHGIFRLTSSGMSVIRQCPRRGFHSHDPSSDGMPIYSQCTDVYMNSGLKIDVIDLR